MSVSGNGDGIAAADTTIRYIRDMENGKKRNPSIAMVYRLSAALEVHIEALAKQKKGELKHEADGTAHCVFVPSFS